MIVRWLLGALFLVACYQKIIEPAHFAKIIYGYYLFPDAAINLIAIILPYVELFSGMALILGIYPRSAALIINAMLLALSGISFVFFLGFRSSFIAISESCAPARAAVSWEISLPINHW
ncbi:MAG: DoxX family membrane protein [Deltaproteobacteria bacterium]|nr:DoxX family membrane protein [Deltaproteobacteria bacterium]